MMNCSQREHLEEAIYELRLAIDNLGLVRTGIIKGVCNEEATDNAIYYLEYNLETTYKKLSSIVEH